jgi:hypothetical protein
MRYIARSRTTASKVRHFRAGSLAAAVPIHIFGVTGEPMGTQIALRGTPHPALPRSPSRAMAEMMSPLMTIRRFEALAHGALPRPIDTVVIVAGGFLVLGTELIRSSNGTAFDAAIIPGLIVTIGDRGARRARGCAASAR